MYGTVINVKIDLYVKRRSNGNEQTVRHYCYIQIFILKYSRGHQ